MLNNNKQEKSVDVGAIKTEVETQLAATQSTEKNKHAGADSKQNLLEQRDVLLRVLSLINAYEKEKNDHVKKLYEFVIEDCYRICQGKGSAHEKKEEMAGAIDSRFRDAQQPNCSVENRDFRASMIMLKDPVARVKINKFLVDTVTDNVVKTQFRERMFALSGAKNTSQSQQKKQTPRIEKRH